MRIYRIAKENKEKEFLTPEEREEVKNRFKDIQCSFAKDKDGYYCYTHRARSESYPTISQIPQSKVDFINSTSSNHSNTKTAQLECFEDVIYSVREAQENILREYYDKRRKKGSMMSWSVIPFDRLKKIWEDYAKTGVVRDERGVDDIANSILKILARLQASTDLAGHSQGGMGGEDVAEELGFKPIDGRNSDFYWDFLETPYGTPVSDFGLPQLWKIAEQLFSARNAEDKLLLIDQMLNVVHQRGDLAALFIEGGSGALSQLSAKDVQEEENVEASNKNWYKTSILSFDENSIKNMIDIEKKKAPYPGQENIIKKLYSRLKVLKNIELKKNGPDYNETIFEKPLDSYFGKDHPFYNEEVQELLYPDLIKDGVYASNKNWYKTAVADGEFRDWKDKVNSIKDEIRNLKKEDKDIDGRVKKLEKVIDDLNIGQRRFFQQQDTFNSLQRKIERMETVAQEWKNYKKEMDDNIKKQVEKHTKARISDITPKAY